MRRVDKLMDEYGESHQNQFNKFIHWIAVPVITWTVLALLWSIPFSFETGVEVIPVNWGTIGLFLALIYWFILSPALGLGLLMFSALLVQITALMPQITSIPVLTLAIMLFVSAWILQFIGHAVEGKRPSFFKDIQFLLVGPAWLMAFLYKTLGLRY